MTTWIITTGDGPHAVRKTEVEIKFDNGKIFSLTLDASFDDIPLHANLLTVLGLLLIKVGMKPEGPTGVTSQ